MRTKVFLLSIAASFADIQTSAETSLNSDRKVALVSDGSTATTSLAMSF